MGYHVSILRTASGRQQPIHPDEVRKAIALMAGKLAIVPDKAELELYVPGQGAEGEVIWYEPTDGELWTKNPSEPLCELMIELAGHLDARVRGDEGETYRSLNDWYIHPDDQVEHEASQAATARRERFAWIPNRNLRFLAPRLALMAIALAAGYIYRQLVAN